MTRVQLQNFFVRSNMNFSCYCNDEVFVSQISHFCVSKGPHCQSEDSIESLIRCFSENINGNEISDAVFELLNRGENSRLSIEADQLMHKGSELEFGSHNNLYFFSSKSILGILMALSNIFNLKIFVICGRLPFKRMRGDSNVLLVDYGRQSSNLIIGLVGLNLFHSLKQPEPDSSIWNSLELSSFHVNDENLDNFSEKELLDHERSLSVPKFNNVENYEIGSEEIQIEELHRSNDDNHISSVSIHNFIESNIGETIGNRSKILDSAYDRAERIDVGISSRQDLLSSPISELNFLTDIDAFFAFFDWRSMFLFYGDVIISNSPSFDSKKDENNFKYLLSHTIDTVIRDVLFMKIGTSVETKNIIYDIYFCGIFNEDIQNTSMESIQDKARSAFAYALEAECYNSQERINIHPECESRVYRSVLDAHSSNVKSKIRTFSNVRYKCFCFHFLKKLVELLSVLNISFDCSYQYIKAVGMKAKLHSNSLNGIATLIRNFDAIVNLEKAHVFYDIAFSVIAKTNDPRTTVSL